MVFACLSEWENAETIWAPIITRSNMITITWSIKCLPLPFCIMFVWLVKCLSQMSCVGTMKCPNWEPQILYCGNHEVSCLGATNCPAWEQRTACVGTTSCPAWEWRLVLRGSDVMSFVRATNVLFDNSEFFASAAEWFWRDARVWLLTRIISTL